MTMEYALGCLLLLVTAAAALRDWQQRRIPNILPLLLMAGGALLLLLRFASGEAPAQSAVQALAGLGLGALVSLPGYGLGVMGAGDVKLLASIGWVLSWPAAVVFLLLWAVAFALWCTVALITRERTRQPVAPSVLLGHAGAVIALGWQ
ncbi:A24 family peptidase [Algiphilus sp.]|uniref:A24 family peptidase n=1 Tax=Algiphilus sp. TaxID=1872431 RepID=UPI002A5B57DE|nr:A24 family peptidase [Pseudomonadota bacterium]